MTMRGSGQPTETPRIPFSADDTVPPGKQRFPRRVALIVALVAIVVGMAIARHLIAGVVLSRALSLATGNRVTLESFVLGRGQSVLRGVRVTTPAGDPLADIERLEVRYSLRDLIERRGHRYGLIALEADRPILTIVRHPDGSYNLNRVASVAQPQRADGGSGGNPWDLQILVRDGSIRLVDRAPIAADLAEQRMTGVALRARIASDRRSTLTASGTFVGRRTADAALEQWPIEVRGMADVGRGIAYVRGDARQLPLRGGVGYLQHSRAMRVDAGVLHDVSVTGYTLNVGLDRPPDVHLGGRADLADARLAFAALQLPIRALHGHLTLLDDSLATTGLAGTLAGVPVRARGSAFSRAAPVLRLGIAGDGDVRRLRKLFAFAREQPIRGFTHVETLIEAPVSAILIRSTLHIAHGMYAKIPLDDVGGLVDFHSGSVVLDAVHARYGETSLHLGGRFLLGGPAVDSAIAVNARGPGRAIPYAANLAPEGTVDVLALITGTAGYRARGAIGIEGRGVSGRGTFAVDERGVGEFGPFAFARSDGSTLDGVLRLERPTSQSAAWLRARSYRVANPTRIARLAGLTLAAFPPIAGVIDADLAGGGSPSFFALGGRIAGRELRVGGVPLGAGRADLGGNLGDVRLANVALNGPLGRFSGNGVATGGIVALRGAYDGSLERLVPLTGDQRAHGLVRGPVAALLNGRNVVVQSTGAVLRRGSIRGVQLDTAAGTIAVQNDAFHLLVAQGSISGRHAVLRESAGTVAVSAPDLPSTALAGTGLPLESGNISAYGRADLRGRNPTFDGTVAVAAGRAHGYRVSGDAQIDLDGPLARIYAATGALGSTYGSIDGSVVGIGSPVLHYDLITRVPLGDIDLLRRDLGLPVRHLAGSFSASLHVGGSGAGPSVDGDVFAPEGDYNGLAFRDARAGVILGPSGVAARDGSLTVGSTRTSIAARSSGGSFDVRIGSARADLADFNDYFDASDTLAGHGRIDLAVQAGRGVLQSHGLLDVQGLRYRTFALGDVDATWHTVGPAIRGRVRVGSAAGVIAAAATIVPAPGVDPIRAFRDGGYDVRATFEKIDLSTWLPAAGYTQPILGTVGGALTVAGRMPDLRADLSASLDAATIGGFPVQNGRVRATSYGSRITIRESSADLGFVQLAGSGTLGLGRNDPLAFDLHATTVDVGPAVRTFVPAAHRLDVAGSLDADLRLAGTVGSPKIAGGFDISNARYGLFSVPRAIGALALVGNAIELRDADVEFNIGQAFVAGSLPLRLQPLGLGPARAPVSFDVTARGVDLGQFAPLLPAGTKLGGTIDGRFGVEGTVNRPRLLGTLAVSDGSYRSTIERAPIKHVNAGFAFSGTSIALQVFHADVGTGTLDAGGHITLPFGRQSRPEYAVHVAAKAAQFDFPAYGRGTVDGQLQLTGRGGEPLLAGDIALHDAVVPLAAVYGSGAGTSGTGGSGLPIDPSFRIRALIGRNVRVQSAIVDVGLGGALDISGSLRAPRLAGDLVATDGTVSSYNHVFRVVYATAAFNPADGILPTIDARATSRVTNPDPDPSRNIAGSANIVVSVTGTPDNNNLQVTYSSDPPYSQEQIVGLLLDVPGLLKAVNFDLNAKPGGELRGAPGETNALLPPGVTPEQVSAISFNEEVFSLLNGQFTQRALTPIEHVFEKVFGLSDLQFTVDYGGGIGYSLRRDLGKRNFAAFLSQTVTFPERSNIGFELEPKPFETLNFSHYQQNGVTSLITNATPGAAFLSSTRRLTSVQPLGNRSGFSLNFNRRF